MALSQVQSDQVVLDGTLSEFATTAREKLDSILGKVNTEAQVPGKLTASGTTVTVGSTSVQGPDTRYKAFPLIDGKDVSGLSGTMPFATGVGTGDVQTVTLPNMTALWFVKVGFEVRSDRKIYVIFGQPGATAIAATNPAFSSGAPLGIITLQANATGGQGQWQAISSENINQFIGAGAGAGGDSSFKLRDITGVTATLNAGFIKLSNGLVLVTGSGTDSLTTNVDISLNLSTILGSSPVNSTTYYLYIDLWSLGAPITLTDNGRKVTNVYSNSHFKLSTTPPDQMQTFRYVDVGFIHSADSGTSWTGTGAFFGAAASKFAELVGDINPIEIYQTTTTTNSATLSLSHGLSGIPQIVSLWYYDGTNTAPVDASSYVINRTSTELVLNTNDFDFTGGKNLEVKATYNSSFSNQIALPANQYTSSWMQNTSLTELTHGLGDKSMIKGVTVLEWDVTADRVSVVSGLVVDFDSTKIYLDWSGFTPSSTLQYQVIAGVTPMAAGVPTFLAGFTKFVGFGPGYYPDLTSALADLVDGDAVLVNKSFTLSSTATISANNVKIQFMPGSLMTVSGDISKALVLSGDRISVLDASVDCTGAYTYASLIEVSGDECVVERAKLKVNNAGATVTAAYNVTATASMTRVYGSLNKVAGTVTSAFTDAGSSTDYTITTNY